MRWIPFLVAIALVGNVGCSSKKTEGQGKEGKLTLEKIGDITVKQGEEKALDIKIKRDGPEGDVNLDISGLPDKVTIKEETKKMIAKGQNEAKYHLKAEPDAKVGKYKVKVTATTGDVKAGPQEFEVSVEEKKKD